MHQLSGNTAITQRFRQHGSVHTAQVEALRAMLASTGWLNRAGQFAGALRRTSRTPQGLLIVGTPTDEPWHMTAHLADESRLAALPELMPTLVRWTAPPGSRPHLSVGIERLEQASRSETVLVVSPDAAPEQLLTRVADAKKAGAAIFALDQGDPELDELVHESLVLRYDEAPISFDAAQHLVSYSLADPALTQSAQLLTDPPARDPWPPVPDPRTAGSDRLRPAAPMTGLRGRLNRLLETISGPAPD
jgi:hypothetical protein